MEVVLEVADWVLVHDPEDIPVEWAHEHHGKNGDQSEGIGFTEMEEPFNVMYAGGEIHPYPDDLVAIPVGYARPMKISFLPQAVIQRRRDYRKVI